MTNEQLLSTPKAQLNNRDQQRQSLLQLLSLEPLCPACQTPTNFFAAASIHINDYDFGATEAKFVCPRCKAQLERVVPVIGFSRPWYWDLNQEWLEWQLDKTRMWDEQQPKEET